jgi:hypothetical protein
MNKILSKLSFVHSVILGTVVGIVGIPAVAIGVAWLSDALDLDMWSLLIGLQAILVVGLCVVILLRWFINFWLSRRSSAEDPESVPETPEPEMEQQGSGSL